MKVVEQARLGYREGNSDKVYEVDLVEVADQQYVVNFRFGRRGASLRDGTKTPLPLTLEKARAVFTALVAEKTRGGYRPLTADASSTQPSQPTSQDGATRAARSAEELLAQLKLGHRASESLHLVVRKVGERDLQQAEPLLLELLAAGSPSSGIKPDVLKHFVIAALARCGSALARAPLRAVAEDAKAPRHLRDVARLALAMLLGPDEKRSARESVPAPLRPVAGQDPAAQIQAAERLLTTSPSQAHTAIVSLYVGACADSDAAQSEPERLARRIVLGVVRVARMQGQELGLLRTLNWMAELRRDGELFALLARRFENARDELPQTMAYFRRRSARTLRRLAAIGSSDFVKLATELILSYRDEDAEPVVESDYGTWGAFAPYHALNLLLYGNSVRYERAGHRRLTWRIRQTNATGRRSSPREEAYPQLWDRAPDSLWRIGVSDAASVAIDFATRALRDQHDFLKQLPDTEVAAALASAQPAMRTLALEIARERTPNLTLARGALVSGLEEAGDWVIAWVERTPELLGKEAELLALMIGAKVTRVREAVPRLVRTQTFEAAFAKELVVSSIAILMGLPDEPNANERAQSAGAFLLQRASSALDSLGVEVLRDLLAHPLAGVAELGAELVHRGARSRALADGLLDLLLGSKHPGVRSFGARIVAETPPAIIKNEPGLLVHIALSANAELRTGTRSLVGEVARLYPEVGRDVTSRLIDALLTRQPEGAPAHVVALLRHELRACLPKRSPENVLALVGALSPHAREAGGLLLGLLGPDELELEQIVHLANHEILLVRQGAWALARSAQARFRIAPVALARLCDARWEDSRAFAFELVRTFSPDDLVPDVVIAICDSTQPAVQRFGQTLLLEYWRDEHATRYLLRLSEHPSKNIQLLVSGLLERHGRGNLAVLEQLLPCLATILSQVNRGGVAKQRVLEFLRHEAVASAEAAALVAPLLERQSLTRAVSHKGPLIATLVDLHERYPEVPVPISSPAVPLRSRSDRGV